MFGLLTDGLDIMEEQLGFDIPPFVFWIIVIAIACTIIRHLWQTRVSPIVKLIHDINDRLEKTDKIDLLEEGQDKIRSESRSGDEALATRINNIELKVDALIEKMDSKIDEDNAVRRNQLKDRIRQSYGYYHQRGSITQMELESMQGLINSYERCGGSNSFVHTIIEPEMYTWDIED